MIVALVNPVGAVDKAFGAVDVRGRLLRSWRLRPDESADPLLWFTDVAHNKGVALRHLLPVKFDDTAVFTRVEVEVSRGLFRGEVCSSLLDVTDKEVEEMRAFVVRREVPNPNASLSFRAASSISVRLDIASSLFPTVEGATAVIGNTELSNCLLTRMPGLAFRRRDWRQGALLRSPFPTIFLKNI